MAKTLEQKICVSITGIESGDWQSKLGEINNLGIETVALILENYKIDERREIYKALESSTIKSIPLVHLRNDMERWELKYLHDKFASKYLTIHEDSFVVIEKWQGYFQNLFLEFNYDDRIPANVEVERIGGFCVDLAHFMAATLRDAKEFAYTKARRRSKKVFACNHLSGFSYDTKRDLHNVKNIQDFSYLKSLPEYVFGDVIAVEVFNSIAEQLEYKKGIIALLNQG